MNLTNRLFTARKSLRQTEAEREAAEIRSKLALRWNREQQCYEVYSKLHGTDVFKWFQIEQTVAMWYSTHFGLPMPEQLLGNVAIANADSSLGVIAS